MKGPKNQANSYRAGILASQICKIMKSITKDIINHLEHNDPTRDIQNGFISGSSCLINLLYYMEIVTK